MTATAKGGGHEALDAAAKEAAEAHEQKTAEVKAGLVKLGYIDGLNPQTGQTCIDHLMVAKYPGVHGARLRADHLAGTSRNSSARNLNKEAIGAVKKRLARIRDRVAV